LARLMRIIWPGSGASIAVGGRTTSAHRARAEWNRTTSQVEAWVAKALYPTVDRMLRYSAASVINVGDNIYDMSGALKLRYDCQEIKCGMQCGVGKRVSGEKMYVINKK